MLLTTARKIRLALWSGLILALLCGAACKKAPFANTVEQTPYLGLPSGIDMLDSVDMGRLRSREGFTDLLQRAEKHPSVGGTLKALRERVGFDPIQNIDQLVMATRGALDPAKPGTNTVMVARGTFSDPAGTLEKLRQWLGEEFLVDPPAFQETSVAGFRRFHLKAQSQYDVNRFVELTFGFPSQGLMVFSMNPALVDETLGVISGQAKGLQADQEWMKLLQRPRIADEVWGAGKMSSKVAAHPAASMIRNTKKYYYSLNLNSETKLEVGLVCDSIEAATKQTDGLKQGLAEIKPMVAQFMAMPGVAEQIPPSVPKLLDKISIQTELEVTKIFFTLTADERAELTKDIEAFLAKAKQQSGQGGALPGLPLPGMQ